MPLISVLARIMASAFDDELRLRQNHRKNQEVGLLGPVVQSTISANPGLNFNLLF